MRTTLNIDDKILARARELTGVREKAKLVRMGLESLIAREAGARLAAMGGTMPDLRITPRRRIYLAPSKPNGRSRKSGVRGNSTHRESDDLEPKRPRPRSR